MTAVLEREDEVKVDSLIRYLMQREQDELLTDGWLYRPIFKPTPRALYQYAEKPLRELPVSPAEFIGKVIGAIEEYGWQRGAYGDTSDGFCLVGAVAWVGRQMGVAPQVLTRDVLTPLHKMARRRGCRSAEKYNDRAFRRQAGVLRFLQRAQRKMEGTK